MIHGGGRRRIMQQRQMVRWIEPVGVEVRQQMRWRMNWWSNGYIRRWIRYRSAIFRAACWPKSTASAAAHALRTTGIASVALGIVLGMVLLKPFPQRVLVAHWVVATSRKMVEPSCRNKNEKKEDIVNQAANNLSHKVVEGSSNNRTLHFQ